MANHEKIDEVVETVTRGFKQFDIISQTDANHQDLISDHIYFPSSTSNQDQTQLSPETAARIMKEWNVLRKSLPDSIYVRAYEERIDLLRAVIIGSAGTPNHDGLFFFDIQIPSDYPNSIPKISWLHGLELDREVCFELLETQEFSILETLLALQENLICLEPNPLNSAKETFNKDKFLSSCQTMLAILRKPPKHFEEFVVQHFRSCAKSVLSACHIRDGQSKVDGYVTSGEHRIDIGHGIISNTTAISEELEGCSESMKSIYFDKAFTETAATKSLKDDCDTGNIIASDIDDDRDDKCPFDEKVGAFVSVLIFFIFMGTILILKYKTDLLGW